MSLKYKPNNAKCYVNLGNLVRIKGATPQEILASGFAIIADTNQTVYRLKMARCLQLFIKKLERVY